MVRSILVGSAIGLALLALAGQPALAEQEPVSFAEPGTIDVPTELARLDALSTYLEDSEVEPASFFNQPALVVPGESVGGESPRPVRRTSRSTRSEYVRLARVPNMLGDSFGSSAQLGINITGLQTSLLTTLPIGAGRSLKIGENNKPLPMDRIYFVYNGFQNAINGARQSPPPFMPPQPFDANFDRYTFGAEKTFWDGLASVDVRMPFTGAYQAGNDSTPIAVRSEKVGDLCLNLKGLLYADDTYSLAAGMGVTLPTAADAQWRVLNDSYRLRNESVHLLPYVGFMASPGDNWFVQGFIQVDFAASGFELQSNGAFNGPTLNEQNLMYYDLLVGRWLYQNDYATWLTGVAGLFELHYTTSLEESDNAIPIGGGGPPPYGGFLGNPFNWIDVLNLSAGLHFQMTELCNLRVACAVPLRTRPGDQQFDAEILVSCNREF